MPSTSAGKACGSSPPCCESSRNPCFASCACAIWRALQYSLSTGVSTMTRGAFLSAVWEISECTSSPRSVRRHEGVLCPTQNSVDSDFLGGDSRDGYVLGDVAKVGDVRLNREALAQIFGSRLQNSVIASVARADAKP